MSGSNLPDSEQTNSADSGFPPDLLLTLDRSSRDGLAAQLQHQLRTAIQHGRLASGTLLPPSRILAEQLGVARSVVVSAYELLASDGYLTTRQGSGTRVRPVAAPQPSHAKNIASRYIPLLGGVPDPALFPRAEWLRHYRGALADTPNDQLSYPAPLGARALRGALTGYLARVRGVATTPAHLLITSGLTQAVVLVARALRARGHEAIAVEDPGFAFHREAIVNTGLRALPVPVDDDGLDVDRLTELDVGAVLVAPAHSYPTGAALSPERRAALIAWAHRREALIIEDDYDAEFRYDRTPIGALQGLAPDRVAYAGCISKTLTPSLRLGWIALPPWLVHDVINEKLYDDMGNSTLEQLALSRFVETGGLTRHLRRVRPIYRRRRDTTLAAISASLPQAEPRGIAAGLHVYLRLPAGTDEDSLIRTARERGLILAGARAHWADPDAAPPALVIGYGGIGEAAIRDGITLLGSIPT
ncbi:PLP-dependent aminotransferase family protein [Mycobacterium sp. NPDC050441]|uniref:MocR-like pyridoxine biosynthesis transcription factor PdxR n=1 Tax=Mycobacterium sp. NPDC050441 TaxID=3155403 RepID=UPI0033E6B777